MKELAKKIMRWLMTPVRRNYQQRNGVVENVERREMPNRILLGMARDMIREGHTATIAVKGYSMRPFLEHERDRVILDAPKDLKVGDVVLAEIRPDHYVLHRIIAIDGEQVTLMGDGNIRGTESCRLGDVAGIVTHYLRPGRTLLADDPGMQRRARLWRRLLPIRRYLLFVYKALI